MAKNILSELHEDKLREGFSKYTKKAYRMLPELTNPRILDIGCGSGIPTIELAKLSGGQIIGLDINQPSLTELKKKIEKEGLVNRVKTVKCSMLEMNFLDESFDIIWSEGLIFKIGFEKGLKEWGRLLKPGGFMVIHDEIKDTAEKLKLISGCGYKLLNHFPLPHDTWLTEYYSPLEKRIGKLSTKYTGHPEIITALNKKREEIENPQNYGSVFFIMQKV